MQRQTHEAHEAQPVAQLVLRLLVRERIQRLKHQNPEHQHRVVGWTPAPAAVGARQGRFKLGAEQLEIQHRAKPLQRIAGR